MAVTEFDCVGNLRLAYRGIKAVHMRPEKKLQMILGTNGAGKSTIMGELSMLCANHSHYERGVGYKRVLREYKGHTYEGLSDFRGDKNHFKLTKDGKVIYEGHSSEAYQSHVYSDFKLTPDIHAVRIGKVRLSGMNTEARRRWFTRLSTEDYTYAIEYYKRLAKSTRDISGTIDRLNIKLTQERAKLIDAETEALLRAEIEKLKTERTEMMQYWRPMEHTVDSLLSEVRIVDTQLEKITESSTSSIRFFHNEEGFTDIQQVIDLIAVKSADEQYLHLQFTELCDKIEALRARLDEMGEADGVDIEELNREIGKISRKMIEADMMITSDDWAPNCEKALSAIMSFHPTIADILNNLEADPDLLYLPRKHEERATELAALNGRVHTLEINSRELSEKIALMEHKRDEGHTTCPACEHSWFKGFDEKLYEDMKAEQAEVHKRYEDLKARYDALVEVQVKSAEIAAQIREMNVVAMATPDLSLMWMELARNNFMRTNPQEALEYVRNLRTQIQLTVDRSLIQLELQTLTDRRAKAQAAVADNRLAVIEESRILEQRLTELQERRSITAEHLKKLKAIRFSMDAQARFVSDTEDLIAKRNDLISKAEIANHHEIVHAIMLQIDQDILSRERQLAGIEQQQAIIRSLEEEVAISERKDKLMSRAMDSLSPTKGLIARGLTGFINHFIAQMNAIIKKVWLYPLEIRPYVIDDDSAVKLDYNFGFKVEGKNAGKDISEGSGAQIEIFDMAFMLVSMIHLGMETDEVFLDEFSIKMDYAHRKEAMKMITDLLITSNFSQIFMISHYESSYGSLTDADITILCSENIQVPSNLLTNSRSEVKR